MGSDIEGSDTEVKEKQKEGILKKAALAFMTAKTQKKSDDDISLDKLRGRRRGDSANNLIQDEDSAEKRAL